MQVSSGRQCMHALGVPTRCPLQSNNMHVQCHRCIHSRAASRYVLVHITNTEVRKVSLSCQTWHASYRSTCSASHSSSSILPTSAKRNSQGSHPEGNGPQLSEERGRLRQPQHQLPGRQRRVRVYHMPSLLLWWVFCPVPALLGDLGRLGQSSDQCALASASALDSLNPVGTAPFCTPPFGNSIKSEFPFHESVHRLLTNG